ncbi:hypothetical protein E2562_022970 [Oryza meyeriana var. granulata]|uniref:Uncharacterized protein n=1 Tax=Oryza meyeriana var. granulata TaxID=110450 RepID=A0A6G1D705_9ORYZ|nr:hypothetical protein E2562_022970 [Oryza meyeriana var. granulata]
MSLRALASLLNRRFSARGAQAQRPAAETRPPLRSLRTLRDLHARDGAIGALALSSLAGLLGFLYFKQDTSADDSAGKETRKEKEVAGMERPSGGGT